MKCLIYKKSIAGLLMVLLVFTLWGVSPQKASALSGTGAAAGGLGGAAAGAAIGSFVPVVGTAIGAGVGLVGGAAAGALGGEAVGGGLLNVTVDTILGILAAVLAVGFYILNIVLWLAGHTLDLAIRVSIIDFANYANLKGVTVVWTIGRDLANMFFIFLLLSSSIGTMLDADKINLKKNLSKILLIALLINFSLPIARSVIDVSNLFAVEFINKIYGADGGANSFISRLNDTVKPIYGVVYPQNAGISGATSNISAGTGDIGALTTLSANIKANFAVYLFGNFFLLTTSTVLFAGAILLFIRTISLVFIIAMSSLAFFASIVPRAESYYSQWWDQLINQAVFAPAYMFMLYFVFQIMAKTGEIQNIIGISTQSANVGTSSGLVKVLNLGPLLQIGVYFSLLIGLMMGALIVAKKLGAAGAQQAESLAKTTTSFLSKPVTGSYRAIGNFAGRETIGRAARSIADSERIKTLAASNPSTFGALRSTIKDVGENNFGQTDLNKATKTQLDEFKGDEARQAAVLVGANEEAAHEAYGALSPEERERAYRQTAPGTPQRIRLDSLRTEHERDKAQPSTPGVVSAKKVAERTKAGKTVDKEEFVSMLSGPAGGPGGTYTPANAMNPAQPTSATNPTQQTTLRRLSGEEVSKAISGATNKETVINDLNFNQFKSFVLNADNMDPATASLIRGMFNGTGTTPLNPQFRPFLEPTGNQVARENLQIT